MQTEVPNNTRKLCAALEKLGVDSGITYTGGGCWVVSVPLNNGWHLYASRPDGREYGYYYGFEHESQSCDIQGGFGPGVGPKKVAKRIRALMRILGEIF